MKSIASLSLDLDNKWSYMKTHGDPDWEDFPSYLDIVIPRVLRFLADRNLKITFFIVGQDAALEKNHEHLAQIADAGHEIGNHSFKHEPWLHLYTKDELIEEFERSEESIQFATGKLPVGFRGPGFSLSQSVLEVLAERCYEYDCSTLPTYIAPLARAYYFLNSPEMSEDEREKRKKLFCKFSDGFRPLKAHVIDIGGKQMVEIPVTTFPILKTPIHASYLIYLSNFSTTAARFYLKSGLQLCTAMGISPSMLLHPLDFLGAEDVPELKFFPGMNFALEEKIKMVSKIIDTLTSKFEVGGMREFASSVVAEYSIDRGEVIETN